MSSVLVPLSALTAIVVCFAADWLYERSSNVFFLGESIGLEASVRVGHHIGLRIFMSSCVATLYPDIYSVPKYLFLENGWVLRNTHGVAARICFHERNQCQVMCSSRDTCVCASQVLD